MNRSLSEFFGLRAPTTVSEPADDDRTPPAQGERRVSHGSTNSDGSSMVEDGKSGILYYRAKDNRGSTDTTGSGWNLGERRIRKLPEGAGGVALHKDLWKVSFTAAKLDSYPDTRFSSIKCPKRATFLNAPSRSALQTDAIIVGHAAKSFVLRMRVSHSIFGTPHRTTATS